ncbi:hypothetical protein JW813_16370 [Clostridium botulinum]|uniref:hypothetical protein n=1 Tax=Clostridium botulinum TaxID=1491 RepID=UPI0013F6FC28|nr:hypothetical protein [Clostridium botulinum]NFG27488.1 hypothetical protein [Clostridium botulinum]UZP03272.1 hypothetical protein JW813_16370 [Clostridium botulinum]UZP06631.1 hypothetical protein JYA71_16640 [Clostridium botulinum]UZP10011.1 hypothetical protein JYA74_16365 [Clostridium botulinum]
MKKILIIITSLLLAMSLISCNNKSAYKDGIYIGEGNVYSDGYDDVTLNVERGKIVDLVIRHLDNNGKEINYNEWTGENVNGITNPNIQKYRADTIKEVLASQSADITIISEINDISSNWKVAIEDALEKAKK